MIRKKSLEDLELKGKKILMRVDFNVPLDGEEVRDDTRIRAALPTIELIMKKGGRLALVSHLGRPKGTVKGELKMDPVARRLEQLLNRPVTKLNQAVGKDVNEAINSLAEGDLVFLENIRFYSGEESNDPGFARLLAEPFDIFVNDAFGTAHRAHASTTGVADYLPAVAGLLMKKEVEELSRCLEEPGRPLTALLGGAKVSDKINVIRRFLKLADYLLVGGGMANTFLVAAGFAMGASFHEREQVSVAATLLEESKKSDCRLVMPTDLVVTEQLGKGAASLVKKPDEINGNWKAVDIGPQTVKQFSKIIGQSAMAVWNGPLGVFEVPPFDRGTGLVARAIADSHVYSVVGGGDLVAALEALSLADRISFISTGGGATLEFWEGKVLPGIAVLEDQV